MIQMPWYCIDCGAFRGDNYIDHPPNGEPCGCPGPRGFGSSSVWREPERRPIVEITLPWTKPPLTGNRTRGNPYARANEVKQAKDAAIVAVKAARPKAVRGAEVTLHFRPADKRRRDADGLAPTLKVVLDALVACGVLPDDSWVHVPAATCRIHTPEKPAAMWVELEEVA